MNGFKTLEKKYGITVVSEEFYNPLSGKFEVTYKMYSADGCPWEKGLSRRGVKRECEDWAEVLLEIKRANGK